MFVCNQFYSLAVVRINDLCTRLRLSDEELKRKIWTCLEYSIMHQTQLMKDRHLDQILMCAVYVICRVSINHCYCLFYFFQHNGTRGEHVLRHSVPILLLVSRINHGKLSKKDLILSEANTTWLHCAIVLTCFTYLGACPI